MTPAIVGLGVNLLCCDTFFSRMDNKLILRRYPAQDNAL